MARVQDAGRKGAAVVTPAISRYGAPRCSSVSLCAHASVCTSACAWPCASNCLQQEYYYNPQTKVTTWDRPSSSAASKPPPKHSSHSSSNGSGASKASTPAAVASSMPPAAAGRGGLLADIQKGARLKKVTTRESSPLAAATYVCILFDIVCGWRDAGLKCSPHLLLLAVAVETVVVVRAAEVTMVAVAAVAA